MYCVVNAICTKVVALFYREFQSLAMGELQFLYALELYIDDAGTLHTIALS